MFVTRSSRNVTPVTGYGYAQASKVGVRLRLVLSETDYLLHCDVLVEFALILVVLKTEGGKDKITLVELAEGTVSEEGADV